MLSDALLCFGASSVTVDDIADAGNLDEVSEYFLVHVICNFLDHMLFACSDEFPAIVWDNLSPKEMLIMQISIISIYADGEDVDSSVSSAASSAGLNYSPVYETSVGKQCDWVATVQVRTGFCTLFLYMAFKCQCCSFCSFP